MRARYRYLSGLLRGILRALAQKSRLSARQDQNSANKKLDRADDLDDWADRL